MISNSSPLIFLSKINQLGLLRKLFNKITIPKAVQEEILIKDKPGFIELKEALENWIEISNVKKNEDFGLGKGENAAINLARERRDELIIDDSMAIKTAAVLGINCYRTTSVILKAMHKKFINKKEAMNLINNIIEEGYYISPQVYLKIVSSIK